MYENGDKCLTCGEGTLTERVRAEEFEYKREKLSIPDYHIFKCSVCGEEFVSRKTLRSTEKVLTDFRRSIDGFLTSDEIKLIRKKLGKTQAQMAKLLGVGEKNFARYENGQVTQGKAMDLLLRVLNIDSNILSRVEVTRQLQKISYEMIKTPLFKHSENWIAPEYDIKGGQYKPDTEYSNAA